MQRYFHKVNPKNSIILSNGEAWKKWTVIDHDNGVIAPQHPFILENLVACVAKGVGGVSEISEQQFNDWLKKKVTRLPRVWREEIDLSKRASGAPPPQSHATQSPLPAVEPVAADYKPGAVE